MTVQTKSTSNIVWDGAGVFNVRADVAQVKAVREEFRLLFGTARTPGVDATVVELLEQIVLSPLAAKRLSNQLAHILQEYESRFGPLGDEPAPRKSPFHRLPKFHHPVTNEKVRALFQLLSDLKFRVALERSTPASCIANLNAGRVMRKSMVDGS